MVCKFRLSQQRHKKVRKSKKGKSRHKSDNLINDKFQEMDNILNNAEGVGETDFMETQSQSTVPSEENQESQFYNFFHVR